MSVRDEYGQDFIENILSRFRTNDKTGQRCINDECLMEIGRRLWSKQKRKVDKHTEVRKSAMADMWRLATLYIEMRKAEETLGELPVRKGDVSDLFHRQIFRHLEEAVDKYTTKESDQQVKAGLKQVLFYVLKTASKIVKPSILWMMMI